MAEKVKLFENYLRCHVCSETFVDPVVRCGDIEQDLPENPERNTKYSTVFGSEGFSSGTHSWEVEVGDHPRWNVGLVKESVNRKGECLASPKYGIWCLWHGDGKYKNSVGESVTVKKSLQRIRVQLDYDMGEVSFYNSEDMTPICTHRDTFTEKLFPFFNLKTPKPLISKSVKLLGFSSGTHSWEVEVGNHPRWNVGLVKESVNRKGELDSLPEYGIWCLLHGDGEYADGAGETVTVKKSLQRIRVQLDYDMGEVSFYNSEDMTPIYTHRDTFTEKLFPHFELDYDMGEVSFYNSEDMIPICTHRDTFTEKLFPFFSVGPAGDAKTSDIKICDFFLPAKESASSFSEKFTGGKSFEDLLLQIGQFLFLNFCRQLEQKLWLQLRDTGSPKLVKMAEKDKLLENYLSCYLCSETFRDPVSLSCSHSFCSSCLQKFWEQTKNKNCPICKRRSSNDCPKVNFSLKELADSLAGRNKSPEGENREKRENVSTVVCDKHPENFCRQLEQKLWLQLRDTGSLKVSEHR
ncbi:unnamed protein product, partial [Menidia menidia]